MAGVDEVLERLITDLGFRRWLREDPSAALQGYDLDEADLELLASQLDGGGGQAHGVEQRTSKSALFGLLAGFGESPAGTSENTKEPDVLGGVWNVDQDAEEAPPHPDYGAGMQQSSFEPLNRLSPADAPSDLASMVRPEGGGPDESGRVKVQFSWEASEVDPGSENVVVSGEVDSAGPGGDLAAPAGEDDSPEEGGNEPAREGDSSAEGAVDYLIYELEQVYEEGKTGFVVHREAPAQSDHSDWIRPQAAGVEEPADEPFLEDIVFSGDASGEGASTHVEADAPDEAEGSDPPPT